MRSAGYILSGAAGMPLDVTKAKDYYKEHQSRIDRISIINGEKSYDLDQNKMLNDVMELGKNAFIGTAKGLYAITQNDYELFKKAEEEDLARADEYRKRINEELGNETSGFQAFVAGVPIHMLRQLVDVRQWPGIVAGQKIGGAIGAKVANSIGNTSKTGYLAGKIIGNATEEVVEEVSDQLITDGELNWLGLLTAGTAGTGFSMAGSFLRGDFSGLGKVQKATPEIQAKVKTEIDEGVQGFKNKVVEVGENKAKVEDVNAIAEGISVIGDTKGKYINPERIKEAAITINDVPIQKAKDVYLPKMADYILKNKKVEGINTLEEFLHSTENPETFNKLAQVIKETAKVEGLDPETKEAFSWFAEFLERERVKIIDVDKSRLEEEVLKGLYERQGYIPIYKDPRIIEPGYSFVATEIDAKSFTAVSKVKGSKVSDKAVLSKLKKDLYIPEKNIVKAVKNGDEISISWEEEGIRKFAKVKEIDGKYRGNVYRNKLNVPQKAKGKGKIKDRPKPVEKITSGYIPPEFYPTNIMEDIFGRYDLDLKKLENVAMVIDVVKKRFGLDTKINSKTPRSYIGSAYREMVKYVGKIERETFNFLNIDEAAEFYKNEYGLDFDFILTDDLDGSYGRTTRVLNPDTGEAKYTVQISSMLGEDTAIGTLKHEIQHMIDFKNNPDFKSKPVYPISKKRVENIIDYLDYTTGKHFDGVDGNYEFQYIVAHDIDNFVKNGKLDRTVITSYNLDIPDGNDLTELGLEFIDETAERAKEMDDSVQAMGEVQKRVNKYFKLRRGFKSIFTSGNDPKHIPYLTKEFLNNTIIRPFRKIKAETENAILKVFEIDIDGNILNGKEFMNWYHRNGGNFMHYLIGWEEIPEELLPYRSQIESVKANIEKFIPGLTQDGLTTKEQIYLNEMFGAEKWTSSVLSDDIKAKYVGENGEMDMVKFASEGEAIADGLLPEVNGEAVKVPKNTLHAREAIGDRDYDCFPSADRTLDLMLTNVKDKATPKEIIRAMKKARKCMKTKDFISLIKKHDLVEIPEVKEFLERNKSLFDEIDEKTIKANKINSQKEMAKIVYTLDMSSHRGTYKNPNWHTYAHKFSRFNYYLDYGMIEMEGLKTLTKRLEVEQRKAMEKLYKDMASAYAEKEVFPGVGSRDFLRMKEDVQRSIANDEIQTYIIDAERIIEGEIGESLGWVTKAPRVQLDIVVDALQKGTNAVNLTGPKAFKEFFYEVPSMARDSVLRYGGPGILNEYKMVLKNFATLLFDKQKTARINKAIGGSGLDNYASNYMNVIMEEIDDPFGAKEFQVAVNGNLIQKLGYKLDRGLQLLNWYNITQRVLKLTAYTDAGQFLNRFLNNNSLEKALENASPSLKRLVKNLNIDDKDFEIMKTIKETPTLKNDGVFNSFEFIDSLTPEKLSEVLGKELNEADIQLLKNDLGYKAKYLYENMVSDVSPTEPENIGRSLLGTQPDPINRNFSKATMNFKSSVQTQWGKMAGSYKYANINDGKYDWRNVTHNRRLLKHMIEVGAATALTATLTDLDFYQDPYAEIERRIGELVDNPGSAIWYAMQDYFNTWAVTTGANTVRRPMALMGQAMKGDFEKMPETLFKWGVGTANAEMIKQMYELSR